MSVRLRMSSAARALLPDVRGLPRAFWVLFTASLIDRAGGFGFVFLSLYMIRERGAGVDVAGVILSLLSLGGLVGAPIGGALADRVGRKPVIIAGLVLTAASYLALGQQRDLRAVTACASVLGLCNALGRPAMAAAIADVVPEQDRRRAYGLHFWVINLGFAIASSIAGLLVAVSWDLVFALDAATSVVAALLLVVAMRETFDVQAHAMPPPAATSPSSPPQSPSRSPWRDALLRAFFVVGLLHAAVYAQSGVALAAEIDHDGLATHYGPLLGINGVLIVLLQPLATAWTSTWAPRGLLVAGALATGLGFGMTMAADSVFAHALCIVVWTCGEILMTSTMSSVISSLAPADQRARYQGAYAASWSAASFAPALGAFVVAHVGGAALWSACFAIGASTSAWLWWLGRHPRLRASTSA